MIITNPIPGHEDRNVEFLTQMGSAVAVTKKFSLTEAVEDLVASPQKRAEMQKSIDAIRKPSAVLDLCREVILLAQSVEKPEK